MKLALIGDRLTGKTTIFEAVSGVPVNISEAIHIRNIKVSDDKLTTLSQMYNPKKTTYAELELIDFNRALDSGNNPLGSPQLVSKYRELDGLVFVVGVIDDLNTINNKARAILEEIYLVDTMLIETKVERLKKGKHDKTELALYEKLLKRLENIEPIKISDFNDIELKLLASYQLLVLKNISFVINVDDSLISEKIDFKLPYTHMILSAEIEKEISKMEGNDRLEFLGEYGLKEPAIDRFLNMIYTAMDLISFYTVGKDEVRAWSIERGSNAVIAASKIHTDIARGFIRANTIGYDDFIKTGSEEEAKKQGLARDEGKDYIVVAGDIIHFKFNV